MSISESASASSPDPVKFTASATTDCLTPEAVRLLTELDFQQITDRSELPQLGGVYVWAQSWTSPIYYTGEAHGTAGLSGRVGQEMGQLNTYRTALDGHIGNKLDNDHYAWWNPLSKAGVKLGLTPFIAPTKPAPWGQNYEYAPATPKEWEAFISECSRLLTGHRSILGGGAWWCPRGSVSERMNVAAIARLKWLQHQGLLEEEQLA